ncbi:DUF438 domain-containing protein [bacterium]|nr:DUF438 domain-containing protein [bacterium]
MTVTADTKVHDLLSEHPYLKEWLTGYAPEFEKLTNPVVYNTVGRVATIEAAARMASLEPDALVDAVREQIARHGIAAQEMHGAPPRLGEDERARRQEVLKGLIRELHDGASTESVKARFDELVRDIDAAEVAMMEQALIAEGMPVSEVQRLCDVHVSVFKESLDETACPSVAESHPLDAYIRENGFVTELTAHVREQLEKLPGTTWTMEAILDDLENLGGLAVHYRRKENQLFPALEAHGVEGPTKVMWALDDDIIAMLKNDVRLAREGDVDSLLISLPRTLTAIDDMVYKEEKILFPTALQVVTEEEWNRMAAGDSDIGYAWIEGAGERAEVTPAAEAVAVHEAASRGSAALPLTTGALTREQIDLLIGALPFDLSFADENDRVRFYSEGERVFPRSPEVIGRAVTNCHPPKSVHKVEEILAAFKSGEKDVADFWIEMNGAFIYIRYFAMRDAAGTYRGCLEVVQDVTHIRELKGERRIVDW